LAAGDWWDWGGVGGGGGRRRGEGGDAFGICVVRALTGNGVSEGSKTHQKPFCYSTTFTLLFLLPSF